MIDRVTGLTAPGPRGLPLLGNLFPFRRDVLRLLVESRDRFGDLVRFRLGPNVVHLAAHPDLVRQVLQERADLYDKETRSSVRIREMTGLGLLTANGENWRRERRLIQPAFRPAAVAGFVERMTEAAAAMLERWERPAAEGRPIDVASEMMRLTYTIVGRTLFSADVASDADEVEHAMAVMLGHTYGRLQRIVAPPSWLPTPGNRRFNRALAAVDRVVYRILSERRRMTVGASDTHDLLSILLRERDEETGTGMSDPQLRNETITLLLAGHETTANALAWTFYLLARHPEEMERLRHEAATEATERAFKEAMRLYPPIWAMERRAVAEDELGGFRIPPGSTVVVSPWVTHRHPDLWDEPERFDPGRFSEERSEGRPPLAYIPFGAGPRFCVGAHFAMVEGVTILSMVLRRWRLRLVPGHPVVPRPGITLRARDGVRVTLEPW
ncbi:MAG TPA: cytochrome P450 [Thermoanaerobaculia bacterium]|nr:cytochrome P450 [Thermoanaerobaculia bacterium]